MKFAASLAAAALMASVGEVSAVHVVNIHSLPPPSLVPAALHCPCPLSGASLCAEAQVPQALAFAPTPAATPGLRSIRAPSSLCVNMQLGEVSDRRQVCHGGTLHATWPQMQRAHSRRRMS